MGEEKASQEEKRALITGINGQDGSYLAELLLSHGYQVYGMVRRSSTPNLSNLAGVLDQVNLVHGDLLDESSLIQIIDQVVPTEVYNLAAQSHVGLSFSQPITTMEVTGLGAIRLLEAMRLTGSRARLYQASSSEIVGQADQGVFRPRSPYAAAKLVAHWATINYRESYGIHGCAGILYNHESPRRGIDFVTRKITLGVAKIATSLHYSKLSLGNLDTVRDWGYAPDYARAIWLMLQAPVPKEYVVATGESHTVRDFVRLAFECVGIDDWEKYVEIDSQLYRPNEVFFLEGDAGQARTELGWSPSVSFEELVRIMVEHDLEMMQTAGSLI